MNAERYIDVSDLTDRAEDLESELETIKDETGGPEAEMSLEDWIESLDVSRHPFKDTIEEAQALRDTLEELRGNGGDHQWRGDWYPAQLIHEDAFEEYMDEMLEDCGEIPKNLPCYLKIEVDYAALQQDYTTIEIDGEAYLYR